jgi:hypothetical protein
MVDAKARRTKWGPRYWHVALGSSLLTDWVGRCAGVSVASLPGNLLTKKDDYMAIKYIIEISQPIIDENTDFSVNPEQRLFRIEITAPIVAKLGPSWGTWRCLGKGFLRYDRGATKYLSGISHGVGTINNISGCPLYEGDLIFSTSRDSLENGMILEKVHNFVGVNDGGRGSVKMSWVIGLDPGWITWFVVKVV